MRFVLRIEIPALDALVAWLKSTDQAKIDARAATVTSIAAKLKTVNAALKAATE